MMLAQSPHRVLLALLTTVAAALMGLGTTATAVPAPLAGSVSAPAPGPVMTSPAAGTPRLADVPVNGVTEQIRQLVQCGSTMYAVGTFTLIKSGSTSYTREGAFSFSASEPFHLTSFDPEVNGEVDTIAFDGSDCSHAYLGGAFTSIGGATVKDIAEVDTTTGEVVPGFGHSASGRVETIVASGGHLLVGGIFTSINNSTADPYFASLNPTTGVDDHYLSLGVSGSYTFVDQMGKPSVDNPTEVYNQQISPDGTRDLVQGDFTLMGGQLREQVAMVDLGGGTARLDSWFPTQFEGECSYNVPFYSQAAAWSPDGSTVYLADTGYRPSNAPGDNPSDPRAGMCDSASAFSVTATATVPAASLLWINYTGCDSLFSVAADATTVYFGGHERWSENPDGCDAPGTDPVPVDAPGMEGLSPADGSLIENPTRSRGLGADDMAITAAGLWIASDNFEDSSACGEVNGAPATEHAGICLLPYENPIASSPVVTGTPQVGHTVTCAEPGQAGVTVSYTWLLGDTQVARGASYLVPGTAYGKSLSCQASLQRGTGPVSSAAAAAGRVAVGRALVATTAPTLARAAKVGHTDRVRLGAWSPKATTYAFQWYVAGTPVKHAKAATYLVPRRAAGKRLRCRVTASAVGYASGRRLSRAVTVPRLPKHR